MDSEPTTLNSQLLTPARLMWVLDIGESTEAAWRAEKRISFFRQGRIVRYDPAAVLEFLERHTVQARRLQAGLRMGLTPGSQNLAFGASDWQRIERLISDQVEAHGLKAKYPLSKAA